MSHFSDSIKEAEKTNSLASAAELRRDWDKAFSLYIKTAQSYLEAFRTIPSTNEQLRGLCKTKSSRALERAEKIKGLRSSHALPIAIDIFSEHEQAAVLRKSSFINGIPYNEWHQNRAVIHPTDAINVEPSLSPGQRSYGAEWKRPEEVLTEYSLSISDLSPQDILQLAVDDCSLCASLSVCLEHHRRFNSKLGMSSLYPQDVEGLPTVSSGGWYSVRVLINGAYRSIVVSDSLPFDSRKQLICMSTGSKNSLWPALIEKAYMKLMGGYEFNGSNSCIDLHALAGWIPEHLDIKSPSFERERTWQRILQGFKNGHCVITLGTAARSDVRWRGRYLLGAHSQAVIDVHELDDERLLTVIDSKVGEVTEDDPRVIQIPWDDVCSMFEGLYISWDPSIYAHELKFNGMWKREKSDNPTNPLFQFLQINNITSELSQPSEVLVVLTRHISDTRRDSEYISLRVETLEDVDGTYAPSSHSIEGKYTNSPHILGKVTISANTTGIAIATSYDGPIEEIGFTLSIYSQIPFEWDRTNRTPPFRNRITGSLTNKNSGGNFTYPTYMFNPQYHLRVHSRPNDVRDNRAATKHDTSLLLEGPKDCPLNITLVWSKGERVSEYSKTEVVANSGPYNYGLARVAKKLSAGDYTVVVSAFEPHHVGDFSLLVESTTSFDINPILQEGAGMYSKTISGAWDEATAVGGPSSRDYFNNPKFNLEITSPTQVIIRLHLTEPTASIPINITVFPAPASSNDRCGHHIITSGPYSNVLSGVVTPSTMLKPGRYVILPSTYNTGQQAAFRIIVYSSNLVTLGKR